MPKTDPYELEILSAFEEGKLKSVATKAELAKLKAAARATAIKDRRVNIRLSSGDLSDIQAKASVGATMDDPVLLAAQAAFAARLREGSNVSDHTKNAQAIAKAWRAAVHELNPDRFQIEALVAPDLDQRLDVLDNETRTAYEFKVSGKNATGEFYKDVVKVIVWNQRHKKAIQRLVFVTEEEWGRKYLDMPMPREYVKYLKSHGLDVEVAYVSHDKVEK